MTDYGDLGPTGSGLGPLARVPAPPNPQHAALAPSSAHIWAAEAGCRGSVALQRLYPAAEDSEEAREGTAAHHYVAETLNGRDPGPTAPNGVPINAEMIDCAQAILIDVRDTFAHIVHAGRRHVLFVEQRFYMPRVHPENWGTPDVVIVDLDARKVYIWDYKYGHRFVDAAGNLQLLDYALGVAEYLALDPETAYHEPASFRGWEFFLTIAQPRNYHQAGPMREWRISGEGLRDRLAQFRTAAHEAMTPGAPLTTGDHCRDCSARHACPALQRAGAIAMDVSLQSNPVNLPPHAIGLELRQIDDALARLTARQTGLEEQALGLIRGGTAVPFYTTEYASGREKFTVPVGEVFALGDMLGADFRKPPEAITPGQARTALKRIGFDDSVISSYADKPRGALRLARVKDDAAKLAFQQE